MKRILLILPLAVWLSVESAAPLLAASFLTPPANPPGLSLPGQCSPFGPPGHPPVCTPAEACDCYGPPAFPPFRPPSPPPRPNPNGPPWHANGGFGATLGIGAAGANHFSVGYGNGFRTVPDLVLHAGAGEHRLAFLRHHNTRFSSGARNFGDAGNWRHSYQWEGASPTYGPGGGLVIYHPEGHAYRFDHDGSGMWTPTAGYAPEFDVALTQSGTNFTLRTSRGWRYRFGQEADTAEGAEGFILRFLGFTDAQGVEYSVTTDAAYRVTQVSEPAGRTLQITYADGRITQVSASDGRSVSYTYEAYDWGAMFHYALVTVTYPGSVAATYQYYEAYPLELATMDDPNVPGTAARIRYEYASNGNGMIWRELHLDGETEFARFEPELGATIVTAGVHTNAYELTGYGIALSVTNALGGVKFYETLLRFPINIVNELGYTNFYTNSLLGNLLHRRTEDLQGNVLFAESWLRDDLDLLLAHTNALGHVTTYTRETNYHRVTRIDYPDTTYEEFAYNSFGQVTQHRLKSGGTNRYAYTTNALCTFATNALGHVTAYTYDSLDRLASVIDARGNTNSYTYDSRGYLVKTTHPDGTWVGFGYDNYGNQTKHTNELGKVWTWNYNELSQMTNSVDPLGRTTTYEYGFGQGGCCGGGGGGFSSVPTKIITPSGRTNVFEYDAAGRKVKEIVAYGTAEAATNRFEYDAVGNLTNRIDALGNSWKTYFNALNQPIAAVDPLDRTNSWTYDALGNKLSETRPDATTTTFGYDSMNRLIATTNALGHVVTYGYDVLGNLIQLVDTKGNTNQWAYDLLGHRLSKTYADSTQDRYAYDAVGNLAYFTNAASEVQTITYDSRNRPTLKTWSSNGDPEAMTYDAAGRLTVLTNSISVITNAYDDANQLTAEGTTLSGQSTRTVSYTYNSDGQRKSMTYPNGLVLTNDYTARGQLASLTFDGPPPLATYAYDAAGQRTTRVYENGVNAYYTNDAAGQLLSLAHVKTNGGSVIAQVNHAYDLAGNRTNRVESFTGFSSATDSYGYDNTDQLTSVSYSGGARTASFGYDAMGNLTNKLDTGTGTNTFTANNLNQLTAIGASAITYDQKGNLTNRPGWLYTWNAKNQLTIAEPSSPTNGAVKITFTYDAKHRCVRRQSWTWNTGSYSLSASSYLVYSDWNLIEERDAGTNVVSYVHGSEIDEMIAKFTSTNTVFYQGDAQHSTLALTDASANVLERYRYEAFGLPSVYDASFSPLSSSLYGARHLFQGREWLAEVRLNDHRFRYYSPEVQRWLSRDPIEEIGGINLYVFVGNSPNVFADSNGQFATPPTSPPPPLVSPVILPGAGTGAAGAGTTIGVGGGCAIVGTAIIGWGIGYGIGHCTGFHSLPGNILYKCQRTPRQKCVDECYETYDQELDECRRTRSRRCYEEAFKRLANCTKKCPS